jgi:hypothetical protein
MRLKRKPILMMQVSSSDCAGFDTDQTLMIAAVRTGMRFPAP